MMFIPLNRMILYYFITSFVEVRWVFQFEIIIVTNFRWVVQVYFIQYCVTTTTMDTYMKLNGIEIQDGLLLQKHYGGFMCWHWSERWTHPWCNYNFIYKAWMWCLIRASPMDVLNKIVGICRSYNWRGWEKYKIRCFIFQNLVQNSCNTTYVTHLQVGLTPKIEVGVD
jgi:hypothetical protein